MENPGRPDIDKVREMLSQRDEQVTGRDEDRRPGVAELDEDPAYNPYDRGSRAIKGG
jgi:hypothetical protein